MPTRASRPAIAQAPLGARAQTVLTELRAFPALETRLGKGVQLARDDRGFRFARATATGPLVAGGSVLTGFVPLHANGATHVARGDRPGVSLDIESALSDVVGEQSEGAVIYPGAAPEQDVIHVVDGVRIEELRVLRSARAPNTFTWSLRPGPAVTSLRLRDGRVEVFEGDDLRLISEPIVAFDARDQRRAADVTLERAGSSYTLRARLDTRDLAYPVVLDPAWTRVFNKMSGIKLNTQAVTLSTGKTAVFPGQSSALTVDLYDPITNSFATGPAVKLARYNPGVWKIPGSDKVLLFGGSYNPNASTYEIWDPSTGSATLETLPTPVDLPVVVQLGSGKLFTVAAGTTNALTFDPSTSTWTILAPMRVANGGRAAVLLASGKVLITGGCCSTAAAEVYDPSLNTFTSIANMQGARRGHSLTLLPSGNVLVFGNDTIGRAAELFNATTNTFSTLTAPPVTVNAPHSAITLPDSSVLLVNVNTTGETLRYTETSGFTKDATLVFRRDNPAVALLTGGRVLAAGGDNGTIGVDSSRDTAEVWTPGAKTCSSATECTSGFCVDGYCCDRGCTEQCYACNVTGREGFCSPVNGEPPHGTRTSCSPYLNCTNGKCVSGCSTAGDCASGAGCLYGTCATKLSNGAGCVNGTDCASGFCVDGRCCDSACTDQCKACDVTGSLGTCTNVTGAPHGTRTSCAPYTCGGGACVTACTTDSQCLAGNRCNTSTGACVPTLTNGQACTRSTECTSGFCVDGYCCNTACDTACRTCAKTTALGTCSLVAAGATDPRSLCVGECANGCGTTGCTYKSSTTPCGQSCVGNMLTSGGRCSGTSEACSGATTLPCAAGLVCADGKTCKMTCVTGADCVSGYCEAGVCVSGPPDSGAPEEPEIEAGADAVAMDTTVEDTSLADTSVVDSAVVDTFVADTESAPPDVIAESPAPKLDPTPKLPATVQTCSKGSDCPTGFCVEGVCCDTACTDRCHSCALLPTAGKCTLEPVGVDLKQECGPAFTCLGTCDGAGQCIGAGTGTMCARNRCTGPSTGIGPAYCSGPGAKCAPDEGVAFSCSPYTCAPAFGACLQACATSNDCANGFTCDIPTKTCVAIPPAEGGDDGGCGFGARRGNAPYGVALLLVALAIAARRRS